MRAHDARPTAMMAAGRLADEVSRLAAAAGCDLHRVHDPGSLREQWSCAPLLLLDLATAEAGAGAGLPATHPATTAV